MTKSEVLNQYESHRIQMGYDLDDKADMWDRGSVEGAMEEYSKQQAISFERWKKDNDVVYNDQNEHYFIKDVITESFEYLYNLFLTEQSKQK